MTQTIQQEDIEQEEVIEQTTTVCVDEVGDIIEEETSEIFEEQEEQEEEQEDNEEAVYTLTLSDDSDCIDKEYMGTDALLLFLLSGRRDNIEPICSRVHKLADVIAVSRLICLQFV